MNVFEELIEELKVENLLEETVTEAAGNARRSAAVAVSVAQYPSANPTISPMSSDLGLDRDDAEVEELESGFAPAGHDPALDDAEYFRKRATDQVASLQMVEHIITGIEREYMRVVPMTYNDLRIKQALHTFLKVSADPESPEHLEAEGMLIYEADAWSKALAGRDAEISVANVRRFCENSRPVLSSQALIALAKFYRNAPPSEPVRGKFDFVITRLFSRDAGGEKRKLIFGTLEMVKHLRDLIADWDELSRTEAADSGVSVAETLVAFRQVIDEAEAAQGFDELIASDFFGRTRGIKESAGAVFYVPEVAAAAIESNVRIGNCFIDLLNAEKANFSVEELEEKYGYSYDSVVSGAASKTLMLADLVKPADFESDIETAAGSETPHPVPQPAPAATTPAQPKRAAVNERSPFAVNYWLLAISLAAIIVSAGVYFWSDSYVEKQSQVKVAAEVSLENSDLAEHLRMARSSNETFYGVIKPSWDTMDESHQKDVLQRVQTFAASKGMKRVTLLNDKGRTVGFASADRVELLTY